MTIANYIKSELFPKSIICKNIMEKISAGSYSAGVLSRPNLDLNSVSLKESYGIKNGYPDIDEYTCLFEYLKNDLLAETLIVSYLISSPPNGISWPEIYKGNDGFWHGIFQIESHQPDDLRLFLRSSIDYLTVVAVFKNSDEQDEASNMIAALVSIFDDEEFMLIDFDQSRRSSQKNSP